MVCIILSPELKYRYEQQRLPIGVLSGPPTTTPTASSSNAIASTTASAATTLLIQWRVPYLSEPLNHPSNVASLMEILNPVATLTGKGLNTTIGITVGGSAPLLLPLQPNSLTFPTVPPTEALQLFLFDTEKLTILKPIDPNFSADELKLSNMGTNSSSSPNRYSADDDDTASLSTTTNGRMSGGPLLSISTTSRFGILVAANTGPALAAYYSEHRAATDEAKGPNGKFISYPLTASLNFIRVGGDLSIAGIRRQRVRKNPPTSVAITPTTRGPANLSVPGSGWKLSGLAIALFGSTINSGAAAEWYDGSDRPAIVTFRVSKGMMMLAPNSKTTASSALASPAVMIGLIDKKLADQLIVTDTAEANETTSEATNITGKNSSRSKSEDPSSLPLPLPYVIQLLGSNQLGAPGRVGASTTSTTQSEPPKCMMVDVATGSLLAAPYFPSPFAHSGGDSEAAASQQTMPAVYALSDDSEYYPTYPAADGDIKKIATPITLQLTPPDSVTNASQQPPVAILRVLCQGQVLHSYAFVATRKQLRGLVPVVQISTPNTVVDIE